MMHGQNHIKIELTIVSLLLQRRQFLICWHIQQIKFQKQLLILTKDI